MTTASHWARTSLRSTQVSETRIKLLPGWKRILKVAAGCWLGSDGHQPSSRSAQTRVSPTSCCAWDSSREARQLLCRAGAKSIAVLMRWSEPIRTMRITTFTPSKSTPCWTTCAVSHALKRWPKRFFRHESSQNLRRLQNESAQLLRRAEAAQPSLSDAAEIVESPRRRMKNA